MESAERYDYLGPAYGNIGGNVLGLSEFKYGELKYGSEIEKGLTVDDLSPDLIKYLPQFLRENETIKLILNEVFSKEIGALKLETFNVLEQFFVSTAIFGLDIWERLLGIPISKEKSIPMRREIIKAKLRGNGTATKNLISQVASAYSNTVVDVIENPKEYKFIIKFVGGKGIPPNMKDLTRTIEEIKPAHLTFDYEYTYCVWDWSKDYTWNELKNMSWNNARTNVSKRSEVICSIH